MLPATRTPIFRRCVEEQKVGTTLIMPSSPDRCLTRKTFQVQNIQTPITSKIHNIPKHNFRNTKKQTALQFRNSWVVVFVCVCVCVLVWLLSLCCVFGVVPLKFITNKQYNKTHDQQTNKQTNTHTNNRGSSNNENKQTNPQTKKTNTHKQMNN